MEIQLSPEEISLFKEKALQWAVSHETACYLDSNFYSDPYSSFDVLVAAGKKRVISSDHKEAFSRLKDFLSPGRWHFGFLGYDLKNDVEALESGNPDFLNFPDLFFFEPQHLICIKGNCITVLSDNSEQLFEKVNSFNYTLTDDSQNLPEIKSRFSFEEYCSTVERVKEHILRGDIYEMNLCQEFYAESASVNPLNIFRKLNQLSPTPFANFFKNEGRYIISATPERFLCRRGSKLISQPIKGTIKRSQDARKDQELKFQLENNEKERAENVMIVDLVRNDLTKCARPASVQVEELCGIYSFRHVHQMISTVVAEVDENQDNAAIIKAAFPMGSMTSAPKLRAMQLIEKFELSKRGIFSGAVGYFSPDGDFDFNVIIRTLLYNEAAQYLSFQVGSAITFASDARSEYEECLVKAEALFNVLSD